MKEIFKKLMSVQKELRAPKSQFNEFNKFNYRNAEDILEAVKPLLDKYGLTIILSDELEHVGDRYYIRSTVMLSDGEDEIKTTAFAREDEIRPGMSESQVTGCSSSYARKYALCGLFAISDGASDPDSMDNSSKTNQSNNESANPRAENIEILKTFCSSIKNSVDKDALKRFWDFYSPKMETWKGVLKPEALWERWITPKPK